MLQAEGKEAGDIRLQPLLKKGPIDSKPIFKRNLDERLRSPSFVDHNSISSLDDSINLHVG